MGPHSAGRLSNTRYSWNELPYIESIGVSKWFQYRLSSMHSPKDTARILLTQECMDSRDKTDLAFAGTQMRGDGYKIQHSVSSISGGGALGIRKDSVATSPPSMSKSAHFKTELTVPDALMLLIKGRAGS